jgi:hypothetical protein
MLDYVRSGYGPTTFSVMVLDAECYGVCHYAEYIVVPVLIGGRPSCHFVNLLKIEE